MIHRVFGTLRGPVRKIRVYGLVCIVVTSLMAVGCQDSRQDCLAKCENIHQKCMGRIGDLEKCLFFKMDCDNQCPAGKEIGD